MTDLEQFSALLRHVFSEPRAVALIEWHHEHPSLSQQLFTSVPRAELERFAAGEGWEDPARVVSIVAPPDEPDWDWWEPTSEWRRKDARDREFNRRRTS